jgi:hypothetical protein
MATSQGHRKGRSGHSNTVPPGPQQRSHAATRRHIRPDRSLIHRSFRNVLRGCRRVCTLIRIGGWNITRRCGRTRRGIKLPMWRWWRPKQFDSHRRAGTELPKSITLVQGAGLVPFTRLVKSNRRFARACPSSGRVSQTWLVNRLRELTGWIRLLIVNNK